MPAIKVRCTYHLGSVIPVIIPGMDENTPPTTPETTHEPLAPAAATRHRRVMKRPDPRPTGLTAWLIALPLVFLLGLTCGWVVWGQSPTAANTQVTLDQSTKRFSVPDGGNASLGPANAPVTIVEFSDYQCPFCVRWNQEVSARLMADYQGKIRFVYRDFPLSSIHPEAEPAAEAADCAGEQNVYYKYHDLLFGQKYGLGKSAYVKYASDLGLNMEQFNTCVNDHRYLSEIQTDMKFGSSLGVSSTPTFFVNGLAVVGEQPYEVFQQIIDKELAAAK